MQYTAIEAFPGYEQFYVHGATVSGLATLLDAAVPWVWLLGHRPNRARQWWEATIPLNVQGCTFAGLVRDLDVDLQLATSEFVSRSEGLDDHGVLLIQSHRKMPDTLSLDHLGETEQRAVLLQNAATMRILLPHAVETALVQSFVPGYLATAVRRWR